MIKPGDLPANNWEEKYKKEHKLRQEAEGEITIVKGIGQNSPEMKAAKEEINTLKNKIADFEETLKSRDYTRQHDYQFLIDENRRLEEERNMLTLDNKRLAEQIDDQVNALRKGGLL
jgi:hypothetical protein